MFTCAQQPAGSAGQVASRSTTEATARFLAPPLPGYQPLIAAPNHTHVQASARPCLVQVSDGLLVVAAAGRGSLGQQARRLACGVCVAQIRKPLRMEDKTTVGQLYMSVSSGLQGGGEGTLWHCSAAVVSKG